jgi:hypothetical protein
MAFSVSPSVIVREVDASAAVPAIATPPAAIAGVFRWGPVNETVLVSSENELVDRFGTPDDDNYETFFTAADYLSYSSALWVTRVDDGSVAAEGVTDLIYFDAKPLQQIQQMVSSLAKLQERQVPLTERIQKSVLSKDYMQAH